MAKEAVFTMKLEPELREAFMAAAEAADRPASQIVREFMRDFVRQDREYVEFLRRKVEAARADIAAGRVYTDEEVRAHMDQLLANLERKSREAAE
jgi:predicted transcriptional regulator